MGKMLEIELTDEEVAKFEAQARSRNISLGEQLRAVLNLGTLLLAESIQSLKLNNDFPISSEAQLAERSFESADRPQLQVEPLVVILKSMEASEVRKIFSDLIASRPDLRRIIDTNTETSSAQKSRTEAISERIMDQKTELYRRLAK